jgi:hypothetical protein
MAPPVPRGCAALLHRMASNNRRTRRRRLAALGAVGSVALIAGFAAGAGDDPDSPRRGGAPVLGSGAPLEERLEAAAEAVDEVARRERGELGVALAPVGEGRVHTGGELLQGRAWSAIKVPLVAAFLKFRAEEEDVDAGVGVLSMRDRKRIDRALTRSNNEAASDLYGVMVRAEGNESARSRVQAALRTAGDRGTVVATRYGTTTWRLADALGYFRALSRGCALPAPDTLLVLSYMSRVVRSHRWGVPAAAGVGTPVAFKGGWGPGDDLRWLVEQIAIVGHGDSAYVVALMAHTPVRAPSLADPRSYNAARRLLRRGADAVQAVVGPPDSGPGAPAARC